MIKISISQGKRDVCKFSCFLNLNKLDKFEKALVERRLRPGESSGDTPTGQIIAVSDKLESNLISESPLCDYVESFVYPRSDLPSPWNSIHLLNIE